MPDIKQISVDNTNYNISGTVIVLEDNNTTEDGDWKAKTNQITSLVDGQMFLYKVPTDPNDDNSVALTITANADVLANGIIPLSTIQRRRCRAIQNGSNSVVLNATGYYKVTGSVTFTAPVAGTITVELQKNGLAVPGITASTTITTANTEVRTLNISGIIRVFCNEGIATLTLVNSGLAITVQNVALDVEYLD